MTWPSVTVMSSVLLKAILVWWRMEGGRKEGMERPTRRLLPQSLWRLLELWSCWWWLWGQSCVGVQVQSRTLRLAARGGLGEGDPVLSAGKSPRGPRSQRGGWPVGLVHGSRWGERKGCRALGTLCLRCHSLRRLRRTLHWAGQAGTTWCPTRRGAH